MCSYPCFGLSKTGFTPPSQLLKLIILFYIKKTKTVSLPMQESTSKTASLLIQESTAKTESSILYIYRPQDCKEQQSKSEAENLNRPAKPATSLRGQPTKLPCTTNENKQEPTQK